MKKAKITKTAISIEGLSISRAFVESHESEAAFLQAMSDTTHSVLLEGDKNREAKLKEAYALVQGTEQKARRSGKQ